MAYIKRNDVGKIHSYSLAVPVDEAEGTQEAGWEFISDTSQELQGFLDSPRGTLPTTRWRDFRNAVETSEAWFDMTSKSLKASALGTQISNILWNAQDDVQGLALRWQLLVQEASPNSAQVGWIQQKAIEFDLPQEIIDLLGQEATGMSDQLRL